MATLPGLSTPRNVYCWSGGYLDPRAQEHCSDEDSNDPSPVAASGPGESFPPLDLGRGVRPRPVDITIRRFEREDHGFVERCLDSQLKEKSRRAPLRDIHPWQGFGRAHAADLRKSVLRRRGLFLVAEVKGELGGFAVGTPIVEPAWVRRGWSFSRPFYILESYAIPKFRRFGLEGELVRDLERRFARRGFDFVITAHHAGDANQSGILRASKYGAVASVVGKWLSKNGTGGSDR
jgi:GNAT superfamily N-acetyltransferase